MAVATPPTDHVEARRAPRLFSTWPSQAVATVVVAVLVGFVVSANDAEGFFWITLTWAAWLLGTAWAFLRERFALAFAGLQAFMLISVVKPASDAYFGGGVYLFGVNYSDSLVDGLQMVALAQVGLTAGAMLVHLRPLDETPRRLAVRLPWRQVDRLMVAMGIVGVLGLVAFTLISGSSLASANVFAAGTNYGDLQEDTPGPQVKYFLTLQSLYGSAMVLAVLRLTGRRSKYITLPIIILVTGAFFLAMGGQRQRLIVPLIALGLVWWKTAKGPLPRKLRTLALVGGLALFTLSAFVNILRNDPVEGQESVDTSDITAVLDDQAGERSDLFATTAGLAENVPANNQYLGGVSYLELAVLPIPRAVWEDKPIGKMPELQGNFFDTKIGASFPEYGEMYANFGLVGVAIGCTLFGAGVQYLWVRFCRTQDVGAMLWLSAAIPIALLIFTRNYAAGIIAGQFGVLLGVWWSARAIGRWRRRDGVEVALRA